MKGKLLGFVRGGLSTLFIVVGIVFLIFQSLFVADGDFYLSFPVHGYTSSNAPISAIFDHSVSSKEKDGTVTAFTGESGYAQISVCTEDCYAQTENESFILNGVTYLGTTDCGTSSLCYDGHNGVDYKFGSGTSLYPAISGTVTYPEDQDAWHGLMIESKNGTYSVYYLHLSSWLDRSTDKIMKRNLDGTEEECTECAKEGEWVDIDRAEPIGYVGDWGAKGAHLHLSVKKKVNNVYVNVDPYGWEGCDADPYEKVKGVKNVDLWTAPSTNTDTITHTITPPSKTTVSRGSFLGPITVKESNNSSSYYAFYVQPYIITPDGTTVNFNQVSTGLYAGEYMIHYGCYLWIPLWSELGTFTLGAKLTDTDGNVIDDDCFEFTVVSGSSYASKRSDRKLKRLMRNPEAQVLEEDGWQVVVVPGKDR